MFHVPVVDLENRPLMPTTILRARRWIRSRKATPFWKRGVFCVRLNVKPSGDEKQAVAVGIDPGSKREAYCIKSSSHTFLNVLTETVDWVKDVMEQRRNARRFRRQRKTRFREARSDNRKKCKLPPSTKARWQFKLSMCKFLQKLFPITSFIVEDIKAKTWKNAKKWNTSFSPLEVGKHWFYGELWKLQRVHLKEGWETEKLRDELGLKKSSSKLADKFECHNVDSWVLANWLVGGHEEPDNKELLKVVPLRFYRRQLHVFQFAKGGKRKKHGGTRSLGFKRGSLVKNPKHGLCYVGGEPRKNRISLHSLKTGERISKSGHPSECKFKTYLSWR